MPILEKLLAKSGKTIDDLNRRSRVAKIVRRGGVANSPDLERVAALPRRTWEDSEETAEAVVLLTEYLKTPGGGQALRPAQARALMEIADFGGGLLPIPVGGGKSLIAYLAPVMLEASRPLILMPAKLVREKEADLPELRKHWQLVRRYAIHSYEILGRVSGAEILEKYRPDAIICDEVHRLKNPSAAVTRRVKRYMRDNPDTKFVGMSGTVTRRSLRDYEHIARWALKDLSPLPANWNQLQDWAQALDEKVRMGTRMQPGALLQFATDEERRTLEETTAARRGYRRRLVETPGVVAPTRRGVACSLAVDTHVVDTYRPDTEEAFARLRELWETPDEWPIAEAVVLWKHARELACGFYHRWNPRPPDEWLQAKKSWYSMVRGILKTNRSGLDSKLQVEQAAARDTFPKEIEEIYLRWRDVRDMFKPNVEAVWLDDTVPDLAVDWLRKNAGVVWVGHTTVGERIAEKADVPFFSRQGLDSRGVFIQDFVAGKDTRASRRAPRCVASIGSNAEGRNLQAWSKSLVVDPPSSGATWEQLLGRMHREGQEADEVRYEAIIGCKEQWAGVYQSLHDATYIRDTLGQDQKLAYADIDIPSETEILARPGPRWQ